MARDISQYPQRVLVRDHLINHGKISQLQALRDYGCMRLAAVIHKLRTVHGHVIETDWREQKGKRYAVYRWAVCSECGGNHENGDCHDAASDAA